VRAHLLTSLVLISAIAFAQNQPVFEANRQMSISYGSPSWNTNPAKIDSAFLIVRDKDSGKLVRIQLEETEPDSSQFVGHFSLSLGDKFTPEIFVPPSELRRETDYHKIHESIASGKLERKPVIWKKNSKGQATLDVYDTNQQAESAMKAYQDQQKIEQDQKKKGLIKPIPSKQTMEAAAQAEHRALLEKLAAEAAKRESDRVRLEQIEKAKAEERERQAKALTESEKAKRRAQAAKLNEEAMALFNKGEFVAAEKLFKQAVDLDPENKTYQFKYGVALYRNEKFNEALVALKIAKVEQASENERKYFQGLCYYRLKELDNAVSDLSEVANSKDPQMAPSALFYVGIVQYAQEKYEPAKTSFEKVIDTSSDPRMDQQAEEYIDRISAALMYAKMREQKWNVMGMVGLTYDSNVLLSPDNAADQGAATNISDARVLTMAEVDYRPVFSEHHEWSANLNASLTNSSKSTAAAADPWLYNLSLPYSYKGMLLGKGYRLTAKPGYELLYMEDGATTKVNILKSYLATFDNTFVMNPTWFATYTVEYRHDDSVSLSSVGPDDADAGKYSLRTVQMAFLDKSKKEALMGNLGYTVNAAKGDNKKYNRIDLGATYVKPISWGASWSTGLNAYSAKYPSTSPSRTDFNVTLTTGITKPIKEWVTWGLIGSYSKNNSTISSDAYSKYTVLTTATFNTGF
jgi:tetratricopeptide (TPR) repeat protein